jgi:hypothetical protein
LGETSLLIISHFFISYTRELNLDKNTHLIAEVQEGAKYELATANPQTITVVSSSWLYQAQKTKRRPQEAEHAICSKKKKTSSQQPMHQPRSFLLKSLENTLYDNPQRRHSLFKTHQFYLLGFDNDNASLKQKLGTLIRRGNGTIYWDLNEDVTILVLCDGCDTDFYEAAQIVSQHHIHLPPVVSPSWVIESYQQNKLQPTYSYPPVRSILSTSSTKLEHGKKTNANAPTSKQASSSTVFQGCLFSFLKTRLDDELSTSLQKSLTLMSRNKRHSLKLMAVSCCHPNLSKH